MRSHPNDLSGMQAAVMASFDHAISTDDKPQHDRCPVGVNSWCFYQRALATGQQPGPHLTNVHTPLSAEVGERVKEVYARLAHKDLLRRCLKQKTQNANESLHSVIWSKCRKTRFVGLQRVLSATCTAVSQFNSGVQLTMQHLCDVMGIAPGVHMTASAEKADTMRLRGAKRQAKESTKTARLARKRARLAQAKSSQSDLCRRRILVWLKLWTQFCVVLFVVFFSNLMTSCIITENILGREICVILVLQLYYFCNYYRKCVFILSFSVLTYFIYAIQPNDEYH